MKINVPSEWIMTKAHLEEGHEIGAGVSPDAHCSALMSLNDFQAEMAKLNGWAQHGCSDGGCQIEKPKGMHTNGGCRCNPSEFSEYLLWLACELEKHGRYRRWPNE